MDKIRLFCVPAAILLLFSMCGCSKLSQEAQTEQIAEVGSGQESIAEDSTPDFVAESQPEIVTADNETSATEPKIYEYDVLQSLFLEISADTTAEELEAEIEASGLYYSAQEYKSSIKYVISDFEGAAAQTRKAPGDYMDVSFNPENNALQFAQYVNESCAGYSALFYLCGPHYDFNSAATSNDYSGYYIFDALSKEDGITIEYSNGHSKTTDYFLYDSAETVINLVIEKSLDSQR